MHPYPVIILGVLLISACSSKSQEIYVSLQDRADRTARVTSHVKRRVNHRNITGELNLAKKATITLSNKQNPPSGNEKDLKSEAKPVSGTLSLKQFNAMIIAMETELAKLNDEDIEPIMTQTPAPNSGDQKMAPAKDQGTVKTVTERSTKSQTK